MIDDGGQQQSESESDIGGRLRDAASTLCMKMANLCPSVSRIANSRSFLWATANVQLLMTSSQGLRQETCLRPQASVVPVLEEVQHRCGQAQHSPQGGSIKMDQQSSS